MLILKNCRIVLLLRIKNDLIYYFGKLLIYCFFQLVIINNLRDQKILYFEKIINVLPILSKKYFCKTKQK